MKKSTLYGEGKLYKGNLHTHTTVSDGKLTVEEIAERYKRNGYSFLAITDHHKYRYHSEIQTEDFLTFASAEYHTSMDSHGTNHLVIISDPKVTQIPVPTDFSRDENNKKSVQELIDYANDRGNMVVFAHPHWSMTVMEELNGYKGLCGMEIYNSTCEKLWNCGLSEDYYTQWLMFGDEPGWCFAVDDTHTDSTNMCAGYIMVKTDDYSHAGIIKAIKDGSFFACRSTEGHEAPKIYDFYVEDGKAFLKCDECEDIWFFAACPSAKGYEPKDVLSCKVGHPNSQADFELPEGTRFVRAIMRDRDGAMTWSQPIWV